MADHSIYNISTSGRPGRLLEYGSMDGVRNMNPPLNYQPPNICVRPDNILCVTNRLPTNLAEAQHKKFGKDMHIDDVSKNTVISRFLCFITSKHVIDPQTLTVCSKRLKFRTLTFAMMSNTRVKTVFWYLTQEQKYWWWSASGTGRPLGCLL